MQRLRTAAFTIILAAVTAALPASVPPQSLSSNQLTPTASSAAASNLPPTSKPADQMNNSNSYEGDLDTPPKYVNEKLKESLNSSKPIESLLDNPKYFEGDLDISQEMIDAYYGKTNETDDGQRTTRAVRRNKSVLWPSGVVYYTYHSSVDSDTQDIIRGAIREIERETCIRFVFRSSQRDYVEFTGEGDACLSPIGKSGGRQQITLPVTSRGTCRTHRIVLHEICHSLGIWHEQSRPDRDSYIEVLGGNIQPGLESNFDAKNTFEVDYHGEGYDYASIMHYSLYAFSRNGRPTLRRRRNSFADGAYNSQGRPSIGSARQLSSSDIRQLNRMYNCPGSGVPGILKVYVKYGRGLPDTDGWFAGDSDPYVKITAVDDRRQRTTQNTQYIQGNENPNWYRWVDFGGRISWQYFEMSVWDSDIGSDDRMTATQAFSVSPGYHSNLRHCGDQSCSARVYFDYNLILDGPDCSPNPCIRGTCTDLISAYRCNCPSGYSGTRCELISGRLRIYARYGSGLPDRDGWLAGDSDPYVRVIAYNRNGHSTSLRSRDDRGDESPEWNQWLDFGVNTWTRFTVKVYDEDVGSDDSLSSTTTYYLSSHTSRTYVRKNCDSGYIYFDYHFQP